MKLKGHSYPRLSTFSGNGKDLFGKQRLNMKQKWHPLVQRLSPPLPVSCRHPPINAFLFPCGVISVQSHYFCNTYFCFTQGSKSSSALCPLLTRLNNPLVPRHPLSWIFLSFFETQKSNLIERLMGPSSAHWAFASLVISKLPLSRMLLKGNSSFWRKDIFLVSGTDGRLQRGFSATHGPSRILITIKMNNA